MTQERKDKVKSTLELIGDSDASALIWERRYIRMSDRRETEKQDVRG